MRVAEQKNDFAVDAQAQQVDIASGIIDGSMPAYIMRPARAIGSRRFFHTVSTCERL